MHMFNENFITATENKFKNFIVVSIMGMRKDYYRKEIIRTKRESPFYDIDLYSEESTYYYDKIFEEDIFETSEENLLLALKSLTEKQLQIIKLLELENFTESEAAKLLNISQQGIHKSKASAIKKLKKFFGKKV